MPSPFVNALSDLLRHRGEGPEVKRRWAESDPALERPATVAENFDNLQVTRFYRLPLLGLLHRALEHQIAAPGNGAGEMQSVRGEVYRELERRAAELESQLNW